MRGGLIQLKVKGGNWYVDESKRLQSVVYHTHAQKPNCRIQTPYAKLGTIWPISFFVFLIFEFFYF